MPIMHPKNGNGYKGNGCFSCTHRDITIVPICANNYSNVVNTVRVYCRLKKQIIHTPHERCNRKKEKTPIKPLGDYSHD